MRCIITGEINNYLISIAFQATQCQGGDGDKNNCLEGGVSWSQKFVEHGGLRYLFDIFMSGNVKIFHFIFYTLN